MADATQMTLVDWLDDLTVRFLLNLPPAELSSVPRLCFQVEEAQWFYEDFIRPANPTLPSLNLRQFCLTLFQHCPLLRNFNAEQHLAAYEEFLAYKVRVPVRGAILLDDSMEEALLVRGYKKGASWTFPRGKINKNEPDIDCAIREVFEETGYDIRAEGLVELNQVDGEVKSFDVTMREQHMKLFVFRGVPRNTHFETRTRKEIGDIAWYKIKDLPGFKKVKGGASHGADRLPTNKFYMVAPFLGQLKRWINEQRKISHPRQPEAGPVYSNQPVEVPEEYSHSVAAAVNPAALSSTELKKLLSIGVLDQATAPAPVPVEQQPTSGSALHGASLLDILRASAKPAQQGAEVRSEPHQAFPGHSLSHSQTRSSLHNLTASQLFNNQASLNSHNGPSSSTQPLYASTLPQHSNPVAWNAPSDAVSSSTLPSTTRFSSYDHGVQQSRQPFGNAAPGQIREAERLPSNTLLHSGLAPSLISPLQSAAIVGDSKKASGPSAPEPSKLPPPKLNAHSMKLLDAFRGANTSLSAVPQTHSQTPNLAAPGTSQQAALLNLLKQRTLSTPNTATPTPPPIADVNIPSSPRESDAAAPKKSKSLSINEFTRTLPPRPKTKASPSPSLTPLANQTSRSQQLPQASQTSSLLASPISIPAPNLTSLSPLALSPVPAPAIPTGPKARNERKPPSQPRKLQTSLPTAPKPLTNQEAPQVRRHPPTQPSHSSHSSPKQKSKSHHHEATTSTPVPQFSILQRPGSSAGKSVRSPIPQSPLAQSDTQTMAFKPQLLKRPSFSSAAQPQETSPAPNVEPAALPEPDKKDRLLALFGKAPAPTTSTIREAPKPASVQSAVNKTDSLLNLFTQAPGRATAPQTPEPPAAPQIPPERRAHPPEQQGDVKTGAQQQTTQKQLLHLFTSNRPAGHTDGPETPISPFALGTPVVHRLPLATAKPRSRLGSLASSVVNDQSISSGAQTPSSATPTEAKGFLLDYLNGVVKKEGAGGYGK